MTDFLMLPIMMIVIGCVALATIFGLRSILKKFEK